MLLDILLYSLLYSFDDDKDIELQEFAEMEFESSQAKWKWCFVVDICESICQYILSHTSNNSNIKRRKQKRNLSKVNKSIDMSDLSNEYLSVNREMDDSNVESTHSDHDGSDSVSVYDNHLIENSNSKNSNYDSEGVKNHVFVTNGINKWSGSKESEDIELTTRSKSISLNHTTPTTKNTNVHSYTNSPTVNEDMTDYISDEESVSSDNSSVTSSSLTSYEYKSNRRSNNKSSQKKRNELANALLVRGNSSASIANSQISSVTTSNPMVSKSNNDSSIINKNLDVQNVNNSVGNNDSSSKKNVKRSAW